MNTAEIKKFYQEEGKMNAAEIKKFYQAVEYGEKWGWKGDPALKERVDETWALTGKETLEICKTQGFYDMFMFVDGKVEPKPVVESFAPEALALRPMIEKDMEARLKVGSFNPSSSIEEQTKAVWNKSPDLRNEFFDNFDSYLAYKKAEQSGQIRISRPKIIRQEAMA